MTFNPRQPEPTVTITVTVKEAILLQMLRKYSFGKFVIHKAEGLLIRLETNESMLIQTETQKLDLKSFE